MFACSIHALLGISFVCDHGADVDDGGHFGPAQPGQHFLAQKIGSADVGSHDPVKLLRRHILKSVMLCNACAVDQHIDASEAFRSGADQLLFKTGVGKISAADQTVAAALENTVFQSPDVHPQSDFYSPLL